MANPNARALRRRATEAEKTLWARLRNRQLVGAKFRRQVPLGPFVVDFVCFDARLIVEVDGGQHAVEPRADAKRTAWLESEGYQVILFWNHDVLQNTGGVLHSIEDQLGLSS